MLNTHTDTRKQKQKQNPITIQLNQSLGIQCLAT